MEQRIHSILPPTPHVLIRRHKKITEIL